MEFDKEKMTAMGNTTPPAWPVAFTRLQVTADEFLEKFPCNHIHGVYGDCTEALKLTARLLNMDVQILQ